MWVPRRRALSLSFVHKIVDFLHFNLPFTSATIISSESLVVPRIWQIAFNIHFLSEPDPLIAVLKNRFHFGKRTQCCYVTSDWWELKWAEVLKIWRWSVWRGRNVLSVKKKKKKGGRTELPALTKDGLEAPASTVDPKSQGQPWPRWWAVLTFSECGKAPCQKSSSAIRLVISQDVFAICPTLLKYHNIRTHKTRASATQPRRS